MNLPADYLVIELDDGDSRDFHVDSIRYLPPDYPITGKDWGYNQTSGRKVSSIFEKPDIGYPA